AQLNQNEVQTITTTAGIFRLSFLGQQTSRNELQTITFVNPNASAGVFSISHNADNTILTQVNEVQSVKFSSPADSGKFALNITQGSGLLAGSQGGISGTVTAGRTGMDEVQTISFGNLGTNVGAVSGKFQLSFGGFSTPAINLPPTDPNFSKILSWDSSPADVEGALNTLLQSVGNGLGFVRVTGSNKNAQGVSGFGSYIIQFENQPNTNTGLGQTNIPNAGKRFSIPGIVGSVDGFAVVANTLVDANSN